MRRLLILRHSKAEALPQGGEDHQRGLTPRGHADAARMGQFLASHRLVPNLAVLSSARRVQETWASATATMKGAPRALTEPHLYNASFETILGVIQALPDTPSAVIVAHNPGLHETAMRLVASGAPDAREQLSEGLPTSGLVIIEFPLAWHEIAPATGRLERFVTPGTLLASTD